MKKQRELASSTSGHEIWVEPVVGTYVLVRNGVTKKAPLQAIGVPTEPDMAVMWLMRVCDEQ